MDTKEEKMTYEEKQQAKLERFQELASKNKQDSISSWESSNKMLEVIPFGQPILVGHHSESAHRNLIKRSWAKMDKSIELSEKAEYYENKVENILNPRAISSDDENAITKLEEKKKNLEESRDEMKRINKEFKKTKDLSKVEMSENIRKEALGNLKCWGGVYGSPFPSYSLTNLGANIRNIDKRIEHLKKISKIEESEWIFGENTIKIDKNENRVRIIFPGKPSEEIRTKLKSNGFRWSPYNSAWQRQISNYAIKLAKEIAGGEK